MRMTVARQHSITAVLRYQVMVGKSYERTCLYGDHKAEKGKYAEQGCASHVESSFLHLSILPPLSTVYMQLSP
jgi:hypothetical protein